MKKQSTSNRQKQQKELLITHFQKAPIIQIACEKIGIGRATYCRWCKKDKIFCKQANDALFEGKKLVNDMAESQLLSAIRDKNMTAIIFWLKNNHTNYATRIKVSGKIETQNDLLTKEQAELIKNALKLASFNNDNHEK